MATNEDIEVYRQRYETFRHLDRLRWQMLQIAVGVGSLALAFGGGDKSGPEWWVLAVVGVLLVGFGVVMERIRHGIVNNGKVLRRAGSLVGDTEIPEASAYWKASSFWIALAMTAGGVVCVVAAAYLR